MNPMIKYTLARLGLFAATAAVLIAIPMPVDVLIRLAVAVLISAVLSFVLLRGLRDQMAHEVAGRMEKRNEAKQRLRAALAGEDEAEERQ
jgi:uncharacterized protein DUF4229